MDNRPIGIFDSGVGGLTVFKEIRELLPAGAMLFLLSCYHYYTAGFGIPQAVVRRGLHLSVTIFVPFMSFPAWGRSGAVCGPFDVLGHRHPAVDRETAYRCITLWIKACDSGGGICANPAPLCRPVDQTREQAVNAGDFSTCR